MVRDSLDAGAPNMFMGLSSEHGAFASWRPTAGADTNDEGITWYQSHAAYWVQIQREGNTFTASRSFDGLHWEVVTSQEMPAITDSVEVGMAFTSRNMWAYGGTTFRNYQMVPAS